MRVTSGRMALLRVFADASGPLALDEAVELCGTHGGDRATVWRNLQALADKGVLNPLHGAGRRQHFELNHDHAHVHVVCTDCGRVACVDVEPPEMTNAKAPDGWKLSSREMTLWGACPDCSKG